MMKVEPKLSIIQAREKNKYGNNPLQGIFSIAQKLKG